MGLDSDANVLLGYAWTFRGSNILGVGKKHVFFALGVKNDFRAKNRRRSYLRRGRGCSPVGRELSPVGREFLPVDSGRFRLTPKLSKKRPYCSKRQFVAKRWKF